MNPAESPQMPDGGTAITAAWMGRALAAGGVTGTVAVESLEAVEIGHGRGFVTATLRCELTYADGDAGPQSVIAKLPSAEPKSLRMGKRLALHRREYEFYRHLAHDAPIHSPTMLYGDFEPGSHRFVLILEDLRHMEAGDQLAGATAEQARHVIREIAQLHGRYWNKTEQPPFSRMFVVADPRRRSAVQLFYLANLATALRNFGHDFPDDLRDLAEVYGTRIADHIRELAGEARTFTHGDLRLDNVFFGADGDSRSVALIDWQLSGISCGLSDVASFLTGSVPTEVRREIERPAIEEYAEIVRGMGAADVTFDYCWRLYRHHLLVRLLYAVGICGGLSITDERGRRLIKVGLNRLLSAIEDLDAAECLPARRPLFTRSGIFRMFSRGVYAVLKCVR